jgi:mRNA-degrading endonuclease RelE of RelBE toxin-antitoxin system
MSYDLILSKQFRKQVRELRSWYQVHVEDGVSLAHRWTRALDKSLNELCANPKRQGLAPSIEQQHPDVPVRRMLFRPWKSKRGWRILFVVDDSTRTIEVLHLRHESRPPLSDEDS